MILTLLLKEILLLSADSRVSLVCALSKNSGIGKNNELPWHISEDLQRFKRITMGHPVIMGRKTYESIGKALPGRTNIVLSKDKKFSLEDCIVCGSLDEAVDLAKQKDSTDIFIIGGGQIFEQSIDIADKLYLTLVDETVDADTFFPNYSDFKKVVFEESKESNDIKYKFLELERG